MMRFIEPTDPDYRSRLEALSRRGADVAPEIEAAARAVIAQVRAGGDQAVRDLTEKFEGRRLTALEMGRDEWRAEAAKVAPPVRAALERAAERIRAFHKCERYPSFEIQA